jgi:hypothetical protein
MSVSAVDVSLRFVIVSELEVVMTSSAASMTALVLPFAPAKITVFRRCMP